MRPAWTDEEIISDYLGGVLAATGPSDDAGAAIVALIGRLSAEQLRLHYVLYREVRRLWPEMSTNLYEHQKADRAGVCIPIDEVVSALGSRTTNLASTMFALSHEDLVGASGPSSSTPTTPDTESRRGPALLEPNCSSGAMVRKARWPTTCSTTVSI